MGTRYVCEGSCGGMVTEEEFNAGKNVCGAEECEKKGEPLVKKSYCEKCSAVIEDGQGCGC